MDRLYQLDPCCADHNTFWWTGSINMIHAVLIPKPSNTHALSTWFMLCWSQYFLMDRLYQHDLCSLSQILLSTFICDWCTVSKCCVWLWGYPANLWHLPGLWDLEFEAWTGQWFKISWYEHLQCCGEEPKIICPFNVYMYLRNLENKGLSWNTLDCCWW